MGEKVSAFYKKQFLLKEPYEKVLDDIVSSICQKFWKNIWPDHYMRYVLDDLAKSEFKALKKYRQTRYWAILIIIFGLFIGEVTATFISIVLFLSMLKMRKKEDNALSKLLLRDQAFEGKALETDLDRKYATSSEKPSSSSPRPPPASPSSPVSSASSERSSGPWNNRSEPIAGGMKDKYDISDKYDVSDKYSTSDTYDTSDMYD